MVNNYAMPNLGFGQPAYPPQGYQGPPAGAQGMQPGYQAQPYGGGGGYGYGNGGGYGGGAYQPNPYLQQQADAIAGNVSQNYLYNVAPQVRSGAVAAGGYGGSRQGIAEGLAMRNMNRDIANAQADLYGKAYESDMNRQNTREIARMQNDTTMRGQDMTSSLGYAGLDNTRGIAELNADTARYGTDVGAETTRRGQDMTNELGYAGLENTRGIAELNAETSRYNTDTSAAASRYGADRSSEASMYGADRSADASMNNASTAAAASRYNADQSAASSRYATDASYNLGLGNLGYNYANLDRTIANDNVANQIALGNFGLGAYDRMMGYEGSGVTAGTNIQNTPLDYMTRFMNMATNAGGVGGTGSSTTPYFGNPLVGAIGGYQIGNAAANAWNNIGRSGGTTGGGGGGSYMDYQSPDYSLYGPG